MVFTRFQVVRFVAFSSRGAHPAGCRQHILRLLSSATGSQAANESPTIPEPPPRVKGWPTPWVSAEEIERYLLPLKPFGWRATRLYIPPSYSHKYPIFPALRNAFYFDDAASVWKFVGRIQELSDEEQHHPSEITMRSDVHGHRVTVCLETHSSTPFPHYFDLPAGLSIREALKTEPYASAFKYAKVPGITLRDCRHAILLQQLYATIPGAVAREEAIKERAPERAMGAFYAYAAVDIQQRRANSEDTESPSVDTQNAKKPSELSPEAKMKLWETSNATRKLAELLLYSARMWDSPSREWVRRQLVVPTSITFGDPLSASEAAPSPAPSPVAKARTLTSTQSRKSTPRHIAQRLTEDVAEAAGIGLPPNHTGETLHERPPTSDERWWRLNRLARRPGSAALTGEQTIKALRDLASNGQDETEDGSNVRPKPL